MECIHEVRYGPCSFCNGKDTTFVPTKPIKVEKRTKRARRDPGMVIADKVARGELCPSCLTPTGVKHITDETGEHIRHIGLGCHCSRQEEYHRQLGPSGMVRGWLLANQDEFMPQGTEDAARAIRTAEKVITGLAFSVQNRASRRAGVSRDDRVDPELPGVSELAAERLDILEEFGVDPKWHASRTQEADHLPV